MIVYLVLEQEYECPTNILECYDSEVKAKAHIALLLLDKDLDPYTGYSVKSMEIKREVKIPKLT